MALDPIPLTPSIGARIEGLDLRDPVGPEIAVALDAALVKYLLLVLPGQDLDEDDQARFAGLFGPVGRHLRPQSERSTEDGNRNPAVMMVTNERRNGKPVGYLPDGELMFHTDSCFREIPQRAVSLYGIDVTRTGGETVFVSACRLYETMPQDLRDRLIGKRAVNAFEFGVGYKTVERFDRSKVPFWSHPVLARDARDGRPYVYANPLMTEEIEGLDETESRAILTILFDRIATCEERYVHRWSPGDLLIWDNRRALHARTDFPPDQPRKLRRIPVDDATPVVALERITERSG